MQITHIVDGPGLASVRTLFEEYAASLAVDLSFQRFAEEVAGLPGAYAPPAGTLILGTVEGAIAGCVAVQRVDRTGCEMKRLYVRTAFQKNGCGRQLADEAIAWSRRAGYERMLLDTLPSMINAQRMYERIGFRDVPAYRFNPIVGTRYMELRIALGAPNSA